MQINFITTESLSNYSGGWSGNSYQIYHALKRQPNITLHYIGPVKPGVTKMAKITSKAIRLLGGKSPFYYFSENRLNAIARELQMQVNVAEYHFFMGSTHWLHFVPEQPYGAYLDACFRTYFNNNIKTDDFSPADIHRIEKAEKRWLEKASHVFWASNWAKEEAIKHYGLTNNNHHVVGIGGNLEVPEKDTYQHELLFLFIAQNFLLKGGPVAFETFKTIQNQYPQARLVILGERPPDKVLQHPGVEYPGYLHKNIPQEYDQFKSFLSRAFCLIHPTTSDTIAQVIIECGYFGCPAIVPRIFAIPEIVIHEETGFLVNTPFTVTDYETVILPLIEDKNRYHQIRKNVRTNCIENFTYSKVGSFITEAIHQTHSLLA